MRQTTLLKHWNFRRDNLPEEDVLVPHDWAICGPFARTNDLQLTKIIQDGETHVTEHNGRTGGLPHVGHGEYRCKIAGASQPGNRIYIDFDGVMSHAKVYINGQLAGSRNYGYSSFRVDATAFLHDGENDLLVTADNPNHASRWYPGAGIFRPVTRIETSPVHLAQYSPYIEFIPELGQLRISGTIQNHTATAQEVTIEFASPLIDSRAITIHAEANADASFAEIFDLNSFEFWCPDNPALYPVTIALNCAAGEDAVTTRTGLRTLRFDANEGFFLNGIRTKINGVCMHHDLGPIGTAFNRAAAKRQLTIMREMGCNAIRTSHNPPAPELLDLCDEMGLLVMDEAFDMWVSAKTPNDYSNHFPEDSELDLSTLVLRDRNHPCVILWSIGNEVSEISLPKFHGDQTAARLTAIVKKYDTSRPVTAGFDRSEEAISNGLAHEVDIPGWNYRPHQYAQFHQIFPDVPVYGSETLSTLSSRGIYYFPATEFIHYRFPKRKEHDQLQCSSYCLDMPGWAQVPESELIVQDAYDYVMGQFIWTGFDYLGEPTPFNLEWPARSSYFGCVDLVGLPKDLFYLMQSQWTSKPMVHICPAHWNWEAGQKIDVHIFTNCDSAELFINGRSLGKFAPTKNSSNLAERYRIIWHDVAWEAGEITAVAYKNEQEAAKETLHTAGHPAQLLLSAENTHCTADGDDMLFVTVSVADEDGVPCPNATNFVKFSLDGDECLRIVAADAGNAASTEPFQTPECSLFSGKAVVYLRSTGMRGKARLNATCAGLQSASIELACD